MRIAPKSRRVRVDGNSTYSTPGIRIPTLQNSIHSNDTTYSENQLEGIGVALNGGWENVWEKAQQGLRAYYEHSDQKAEKNLESRLKSRRLRQLPATASRVGKEWERGKKEGIVGLAKNCACTVLLQRQRHKA